MQHLILLGVAIGAMIRVYSSVVVGWCNTLHFRLMSSDWCSDPHFFLKLCTDKVQFIQTVLVFCFLFFDPCGAGIRID
jgi:SNF family Na+-dependent transporter